MKHLKAASLAAKGLIGEVAGATTEALDELAAKLEELAGQQQGGILAGGGFPSGGIIIWSGAADAVPEGWALCDGGNGTPDLRGRFVLGQSSSYTRGSKGGSETVTLTIAQIPAHSHTVSAMSSSSSTGSAPQIRWKADTTITTSSVGSGAPHDNMPPYYVLCYIMKLADKKPSRLPEGYTEIEYIESDGISGISTRVKPVNTDNTTPIKTIVDVEPLESPKGNSCFIFRSSASVDSGEYRYRVGWAPNKGLYGQINSGIASVSNNIAPRRAILELNTDALTFSEGGMPVPIETANYFPAEMSGITILGNDVSNAVATKLYSCKIYYGSSLPLVRDFVPCIDPSGAVGLYDLVDGKFYRNNYADGTLSAGPAV